MAVGAYSVLVFMTQRLLWPLTRLGETFDLYQRAMASSTRVLDVLSSPLNFSKENTHPISKQGKPRPSLWKMFRLAIPTENRCSTTFH